MKLRGKITVPGDKSISHRVLLLSGICRGPSLIEGLNQGPDCDRTRSCLEQLGVSFKEKKEGLKVQGLDLKLKAPAGALNCGNSATTIRLLAGLLAGQPFASVLDGDASLRARPMARIIGPLRLMGADLFGAGGSNLAPISVRGGGLKGISYELPVASAQVKSALLLAGIQAEGVTEIKEPTASRDHTERLLENLGAKISRKPGVIKVERSAELAGGRFQIPGDFSAASFLLGGAASLPGSELIIENVGLNPTRIGFLEVLHEMGADIEILTAEEIQGERRGTLRARGGSLTAATVKGDIIPRLIDEVPILAVIATQAAGTTVIQDAQELRVKESDRLAAISQELNKIGADVEELPDGLIIKGPTALKGGTVQSHGDHRIAMALEIAGLFCAGPLKVKDELVAGISFPGFQKVLAGLTER
ncbi:MAG TPA: 3-phosphoshikimate 1-carboxyvinyltransferase [Firmicutes bacterium]|nr:3-phosphoshikimate 1-carboxyvinyltransferase [Bacillota bacterium]